MGSEYQNEFLGSLHETAAGLHKIGVISDTEMREYDQNCLVREDKTAAGTSRDLPISPAYTGPR
jgi:DNA-binding transcriptional regulator YiaG